MSGVVPLVAGMLGPCAAGHRLHPRALGLRPDGRRPGRDGARRPAPDQGGDRRGDLDGGPRRGQGPLPQVGVGDLECKDDAECIEAIKTYLSFFPSNCEEKPPVRETDGSRRPDVGEAARHRPRVEPPPVRHVRGDRGDRRRRRVLRHQAAVREDDHHLPRALRRDAGRDRRQPAEAARRHPRERLGRQGGALRQPLRRLQHPARLPPGRAGVHGRLEGRARRDHPPRGEDALRGLAGDGAEDHGRDPQGLRRRLLRDERQGLRARPDRTPGRAPRSR